MSSIDWPSVDANGVALPAIISSHDLFEGELFGDELIDIYHTAVEHSNGHVAEDNDIPHLPHHTDDSMKDIHDEGTKIAMAAHAMDDGLGAFRPSASFSDLTTLLSSTGDGASNNKTASEGRGKKKTGEKKQPKKRAASATSAAPAAKRKATSSSKAPMRRESNSLNKKQPAVPSGPTKQQPTVASNPKQPNSSAKKKADTPDPLLMKQHPAHPVSPSAAPKTVSKAPATKPEAVPAAAAAPKALAAAEAAARPATASTTQTSENSEADFKSIAQAAVSTLIINASSSKTNTSGGEKVDTSTEHIKALTGNNWVSACAGAAVATATTSTSATTAAASDAAADPKSNNRARRQNLTPDERARQNRDRNREHARNTRLRKKAYVEELKRTLTELVSQRDTAEFEKRQAAQREMEQREVRFRVIEEFLKLRGRNETNFARWAAILEDGFSLTLPLTNYRKTVESGTKTQFDQVLKGVSDVMADSSFFADFLQTFGSGGDGKGVVSFQYHCDRSNFLMDGCNAVLEWTATSVDASNESSSKLSLKGSFRGKFSPASNKLLSASLTFDTAILLSQIQRNQAKGSHATAAEIAAAQAAASQADALLDSLQMPRIASSVPSAVNVVHNSSSSEASSSEKGDLDSDDEDADKANARAVSCSD